MDQRPLRSGHPNRRRARLACATGGIVLVALSMTTSPSRAMDVSAPAILQLFDSPWTNVQNRAPDLFMAGYGQTWLPPAGRADSGNQSVGYDVYDRFDLGTADNPTLYGSEKGLKTAVTSLRRANVSTYADLVLNHNGYSTYADGYFAAAGGYPGFVAGDFHDPSISADTDPINGRTSGLLDIAQESNNQYVRNPVPGFANNIPAGTAAQFGRLANVATATNRRFYQDRDRAPDRTINGTPYWNFTADTLTTGDPVAENALGYEMRNAQWLLQSIGVDGFRLDATKHYPTWVLNDYFDPAVSGADPRLNLDGSVKQVFSFGEDFETNMSVLQDHVNKSTSGNLVHNRDTLDFPLYYAMQGNLTSNGQNNDWRNVVSASFDINDDGLANNGSQGVGFVQSADNGGPDLTNVAYAYSLMRPGNQVVYFNAKAYQATLGNRDFPKDGRGDALGGLYGNAITTLVDIRNTHGRGNYIERWLNKENLVYERDKSAIVALSNRNDGGYDSVTVQTNFNAGTRLLEMTGNATDATVDPTNVISDYVVVNATGQITFNIPRNVNVNGVSTGKGYVIYGLPTPQGALSIPDRSKTVAGGTPTALTNGTTRLASLEVVTGNFFTVNLQTAPVVIGGYTDTAAGGDGAIFSINGGAKPDGTLNDLNGAGADFVNPSDTLSYGFEAFTGVNSPLATGGSGTYRQVVDTSKLVEGYNYLEVRAFRQRPAGEPAVYTDFKKVIYVDRVAATSTLAEVRDGGGSTRILRVAQADDTADNVYALLDLGAAVTDAQITAMIGPGNASTLIDPSLWSRTVGNVGDGNHNLALITTEPSGRITIQRQTGLSIVTPRGLGTGDINFDNAFSAADITGNGSFETYLYSRDALFNAAADLNADGHIDDRDLVALRPRLVAAGASSGTLGAVNTALVRRGNVNGDAISDASDIDFLFAQTHAGPPSDLWLLDLNVDGVVNNADVDTLVTQLFQTAYGDANLDRAVNFVDLLALARDYGQPATWAGGDFDGSGTVDFSDLLLLAKSYNFSSGSLNAQQAAQLDPSFASDFALAQALLPEPTAALSIFAAVAMLRRRRRLDVGNR